ncbi:NFX1-type zinc finger-containing protein 1-like [Zophobas morio]|uniref:NFX1-type zinc finger-containing protein 1-like n=1 Tax=Zophobas morio TaxID=2755281 RepID=UPI00308371B9
MVIQIQPPPNNFRHVNIYPTQDEILGARNFFRKNIIEGSFESVEQYLDIQFRLLREDFVANVREAIDNYQAGEATKSIEIYENVRIFRDRNKYNEECLKIAAACQSDDKKFMNGSLLLFTKNSFNDLFLAKVVQRNTDNEEVVIDLIDVNNYNINLNQRYTMAECSQYFDPYFQVLNALQNISIHNFPLEKYIVHVDASSIYMPTYLLYSGSNFEIDGLRIPPESLPRITHNLLNLNSAQFEAYKAALTQEFVVIQGPPGTGKTHLGVKIAQTLIENSHFWYRKTPLLVISHKNDALDQFLEGLIPITDRLTRVGSQSKSEKLREFNLNQEKNKDGYTFKRRPKEEYLKVMQNSLVVGMTTSIAARWKDYLDKLKCPIVIVEEAAEVLEAHVVAALTNSCQHLILMGDHQQLQPISADYNIGKNYHLGISLFERMVRNKIQHYQLKMQHRMRPEISGLLKMKIYPYLEDHESVKGRPAILGVDKNVFFIDHQHPEETCNVTTKKNTFEARFLVSFARYLILNGYTSSDIVILATYAGQLQELESLTQKEQFLKDVKVSTLDGFQGQEANIVLLSLVRSQGIGFLAKQNRVCVALSRAKSGFYIMGNMDLLSRTSKLWNGVKRCLEQQKAIGKKLSLRCQNHKVVTQVESLDDFWRVQNGGCGRKCETGLTCGHICSLLCHNKNMKHKCEKGCPGVTAARDTITTYPNLWSRVGDNLDNWTLSNPDVASTLLEMIQEVLQRIWDSFLRRVALIFRKFYS